MARLIDAPVGLLKYNGSLILKTEYSRIVRLSEDHKVTTPDCYVLKCEKYFRGGGKVKEIISHIDREAWEPCEWCGSVGKKPDNWVCSLEDDNGHTVTNDHMVVCATANYCPSCGRPLTEEAWAELERRLRK